MPKLLPNELLGREIHALRRRLGLSQQRFAAELGAPGSQSDVSRWEKGKARPSYDTLEAIARLADIDVSVFHAPDAESGGDGAPDYAAWGVELPGLDRLLDRPRAVFDAFMVELFRWGVGRADMEELGRGILAPISGLDVLYKGREVGEAETLQDQMDVLERNIGVARRILARKGVGRPK